MIGGGGEIKFDKDGSDTSMKDVENKCAYFFFFSCQQEIWNCDERQAGVFINPILKVNIISHIHDSHM